MVKEIISFRTDAARRKKLDKIATQMDRDRTWALNQAIDSWIDVMDWQNRRIEHGLAAAKAGDFASNTEVAAMFKAARAKKPRRSSRT